MLNVVKIGWIINKSLSGLRVES